MLRLEPKSFRQRRPDGNGGWIWKLEDVPRVLYRWPELLQFPDGSVFVCEGEKDADRVASLGHCATCVAAGKWTDDCIKALAGRDVIILEDNDTAGRAKALEVAQALNGTAKTIRIVSLPGLLDKGDVSDWLDIDPCRAEKLTEFCFDVPVWAPEQVGSGAGANERSAAKQETKSNKSPLAFINIAAWHSTPVPERQWVVRDRVPLAAVTLMSGEGGLVRQSWHYTSRSRRRPAATGCTRYRNLAQCSPSAVRTMAMSCTVASIGLSAIAAPALKKWAGECICYRLPVTTLSWRHLTETA